ncbi:MAG: hypothetical protein P9X24_16070 [Candidatus Hatepunaea meridiana]|nr:hypothetical protein [Candidatus Hatepunaea meridiana]
MIDVKEAAIVAKDYLLALYDGRDIYNLTLEEVELSEDQEWWYITLGYSEISGLRASNYKVIQIKSETGQVFSMKVRTLQ